jgi:hypothetical protein
VRGTQASGARPGARARSDMHRGRAMGLGWAKRVVSNAGAAPLGPRRDLFEPHAELIRLALPIHGDQLHVVRGPLREHGGDPDMNHRDVEARRCVAQRLALELDGDSRAALWAGVPLQSSS